MQRFRGGLVLRLIDFVYHSTLGLVQREREFFIDNLLVQIHFIIVMIRWSGLTPWEF